MEAKGGVVVVQKDQTATGDSGLFDVRANTVTLIGNVVVSQGRNVLRGSRLVVDMTTGVSRVEAGRSSGRVEMLIDQQPQSKTAPGQPALPRFGPPRPN
jgi:lipopolysaccharide export system protein LptA